MRKLKKLLIGFASLAILSGCGEKNEQKQVATYPAFDVKNMDTTVAPGNNFFQYANGGWLKNNPIPADKNRYGAFEELAEKNRNDLKVLIDEVAKNKEAQKGSNTQKVRDFYNSGLDSAKIQQQGVEPLKKYFEMIEGCKNIADIQNVAANFQTMNISSLFELGASQDEKNSTQFIAVIMQGGIGLPDRDYYTNKDDNSKKIREEYVKHIGKMFELLGDKAEVASKNAEAVMKIESQFANASLTRVECRDPQKLYNKMTIEEVKKLVPNFDWTAYLKNIGYSSISEINIGMPNYMKELDKMLKSVSVDDWKTFLRWNLINSTANYLSDNFINQDFEFYSKTLSGQEKNSPRWKRVLGSTSGALGEVIGQLYVEKYFPAEAKQRMLVLVENLKKSLKYRLEKLDWMGAETKKAATEKLDKIAVKVGYPDKWRDYSNLEITTDSYVANILNARGFRFKFEMNKIGKPVDRMEWGMTPQTVNAYYSPNMNEIVFPAAILQPPFFNMAADDAVNYGAIGVVIGHELTHGFDDQGCQYDKDGNLKNWWTDKDANEFKARTQLIVDHYNTFEVLDSVFVNGQLTLGENIADVGGLKVSYYAYKMSLEGKEKPKSIDGFNDDQRFFLGYAQVWRNNIRDKELRRRVKEDVHSPAKERVNGALFNLPEFYSAFPNIKATDKLFRTEQQRPVIW